MQDSGRCGALGLLMLIYLNPVNEPWTKVQEVRINICRDAYGTLVQARASVTFCVSKKCYVQFADCKFCFSKSSPSHL